MKTKEDEVTPTDSSMLCVRVRYGGEIKCIEMNWNEVSMENFIQKGRFIGSVLCSFSLLIDYIIFNTKTITFLVVIAFNITINKELEPAFVLTDNLHMQIVRSQFTNVLRTFHAGSMYYINAELQPTNIKGASQMVTPAVKRIYLILFELTLILIELLLC